MSIGALITASGEKIKPILVTSGKTKVSLKKYGQYQNDKRCILTMSKSGWFTHTEMHMVLDTINEHMKGLPCLCIWDDYKAHLTDDVIKKAKECKIKILRVPKGMTSELQPLDFKINGPYKSMMKSYFVSNYLNDNDINNYHLNLCDTILTCYYNLKPDLMRSIDASRQLNNHLVA